MIVSSLWSACWRNGPNKCPVRVGSGKTHTLIGNMKSNVDKGLVPRAAQQLCQAVREPPPGCTIQLSMSVVEIYCEHIRDLLEITDKYTTLNVTQVKY